MNDDLDLLPDEMRTLRVVIWSTAAALACICATVVWVILK